MFTRFVDRLTRRANRPPKPSTGRDVPSAAAEDRAALARLVARFANSHKRSGGPTPNRAARRARGAKHSFVHVRPDGSKVLLHSTQTPPWLKRRRRRSAATIAAASRRANRASR